MEPRRTEEARILTQCLLFVTMIAGTGGAVSLLAGAYFRSVFWMQLPAWLVGLGLCWAGMAGGRRFDRRSLGAMIGLALWVALLPAWVVVFMLSKD